MTGLCVEQLSSPFKTHANYICFQRSNCRNLGWKTLKLQVICADLTSLAVNPFLVSSANAMKHLGGVFFNKFVWFKKIPNGDHRGLLPENLDIRCVLVPVLGVKYANSMCVEFFRQRDKDDDEDVLLFIPDLSCSHTMNSQGEYDLKT